MMTTVRVAARPGVFSGFLVSSFIVRVTSHPQKMKIDSESPATTAPKVADRERVEPRQLDRARVERVALRDGDERGDREDDQHEHLEADQEVLQLLRGLHVAVRDEGRAEHEQQADADVDERVEREVGDLGVAGDLRDQQEQELDGDAGEVRQHEDRRGDQAPAGEPADPRPERTRRPGERGAGVGHRRLQLAVAERDQQHRDEADAG